MFALLFVLSVFASPLLCAQIHFNTSYVGVCSLVPCSFQDANYWDGGIVPGIDDSAIIADGVKIYTEAALNISGLELSAVEFNLSHSLAVTYDLVISDASILTLYDLADVSCNTLQVRNRSVFESASSLTPAVISASSYFYVDATSVFRAVNTTVTLDSPEYSFYGAIIDDADSSLNFASGTVFLYAYQNLQSRPIFFSLVAYANATFYRGILAVSLSIRHSSRVIAQGNGSVIFDSLYIEESSSFVIASCLDALIGATIQPTVLNGTGTLEILSSSVTFSQGEDFQGSLVVGGEVLLNFAVGYTFRSIEYKDGVAGEPANLTVSGTCLVFSEVTHIPGQVVVNYDLRNYCGKVALTVAQPLTIAGCVTLYGSASFLANVTCGNGVFAFMNGQYAAQADLLRLSFGSENASDVFLTAPLITVDTFANISINSTNAQIVGDVFSNGGISASSAKQLIITGNYEQTHLGRLVVQDLNNDFAPVIVNGSVSLSGHLFYPVVGNSLSLYDLENTNYRLLVLEYQNVTALNWTVWATVFEHAFTGSWNLTADYTEEHKIYLFNSVPASGFDWRDWETELIIAASVFGALIVIVLVAAVVCRRRSRAGYEEVLHHQ